MPSTLPAGSPSLLRRLNSVAVLRAIRERGPISRTELARLVGISKPTVNEAVELLRRAGYVSETLADGDGQPRRPGRDEIDEQHPDVRVFDQVAHRQKHPVAVVARKRHGALVQDTDEVPEGARLVAMQSAPPASQA